jgi:CheY-like chemotaxis protein
MPGACGRAFEPMTMDQFIELLKALGQYAWPILAIVAFVKLFPTIKAFLLREKVKIKIGTMEISGEEAAQLLKRQVEDLQNKVVHIEEKLGETPKLDVDSSGLIYPLRRGEKPRVQWVDDFPANNAMQMEKLTNDGFWIDVASTTKQAIEMLKYTQYDLVISDMGRIEDGANKPNAGVILTREIRLQDKKVPVVIFSTRAAIERYDAEASAAGANYVTNSTVDLYRIISSELKQKNAN